jgi:hypothetical protein
MWCAARRESASKSYDDDSADTFPTVTTFLLTRKEERININMRCAARRESGAKSRDDDDSADTFPTVTTFLPTTKDRY